MRAQSEFVLLLARDLVHTSQHLGSNTHHHGSLGCITTDRWIDIETVKHGHMLHVLNPAHHKDVAIAGHDALGSGMQCAHGRAAQTTDCLRSYVFRQSCEQTNTTRYIEPLLQCLVDAAPDYVFDFTAIHFRVSDKQRINQRRRQVLCADIDKATTLGSSHG